MISNTQMSQYNLATQDFMLSQLSTEGMPRTLMSNPEIAKLDHLVIKNFKSFKQQTYTGPFLNFTSIIGPNGSGKSNILDALMFCLCGQNFKHKFFDLREFINREKAETYKEMTQKRKFSSVEAVFILSNRQKLSLRRQLDSESTQNYYINDQSQSKKIYEHYLTLCGFNPHVPNYALSQSQIDVLLLKSPEKLTEWIQQLSGSIYFKAQYNKTKKDFEDKEKQIITLNEKLNALRDSRKKSHKIGQTQKQLKKLQDQLQLTSQRIFLARIFLRQVQLQEYQKQISRRKSDEKVKIDQINERKLKIQEQLRQKQQCYQKMAGIQKELIQLNGSLKSVQRPDQVLRNQELQNCQSEVKSLQAELRDLETRQQEFRKSIPTVHGSEVIEEYLKHYSRWESKNHSLKVELDNKKSSFFNLEGQRQFHQSLLSTQLQKQAQSKRQVDKRKADIQSYRLQTTQVQAVMAKLTKENQQRQAKLKRSQTLLGQSKEQLQRIDHEIQNLQQLLTENIESQKDKEIVKRLSLVDGFKGVIQQAIKPYSEKFIVSFSILVNNISKYLLCTNENASKSIGEKLKDMNTLKTLIILGNVKKQNSNQSAELKKLLPKQSFLAIDIIDYDKNLDGFFNFLQDFCRGKVICPDLNSAFALRSKRLPYVKEIITLNGEVVRADGLITSYGNVQHLKRTYKLGTNKKSLETQLQKTLKSRQVVTSKIESLQHQVKPEQIIKRNEQMLKLQMKKNQLENKIQYLSVIKPREPSKSFKTIQSDLLALNEKISKVQKEIVAIQGNMSKDLPMAEFMKKYKITNLQTFRSASNIQALQKDVRKKNEILKCIDDIAGRIDVSKDKIANKLKRISALKQFLHPGQKSVKQIQRQVQRKERQLKDIRDKIAQLGNYRAPDIQLRSEVIEMEAKYQFMKQKNREFINDLKGELGGDWAVPRSKSDYKKLEDYISAGKLDTLSRKIIDRSLNALYGQKNVEQQKLQKLKTTNLLSNRSHSIPKENQINGDIQKLSKNIQQQILQKNQLQKQLQKLRADRKQIFQSFFNKLRDNFQQIYGLLTYLGQGLQGKGDLILNDSQEPFEHGIYVSPTPPKQRIVYDLTQLSNGQRSITSLALQYSLAITSRAPFIFLDEPDAHLDKENIDRLLQFIETSTSNKTIQTILVSHKYQMFRKCESLIGITRPPSKFSQTFSYRPVK